MTIRERLSEEMRRALKAGRKERLRVLRMLRSELQVAETSGRDFDEIDVIKSYARTLQDSAEEYEELDRPEQAEKARRDLEVVQEFLPTPMSRGELEELIQTLVDEHDYVPRDLGKVMKAVMSEHGDRVDGRLAQEIVREKLSARD
jgi:hypothetical protein